MLVEPLHLEDDIAAGALGLEDHIRVFSGGGRHVLDGQNLLHLMSLIGGRPYHHLSAFDQVSEEKTSAIVRSFLTFCSTEDHDVDDAQTFVGTWTD